MPYCPLRKELRFSRFPSHGFMSELGAADLIACPDFASENTGVSANKMSWRGCSGSVEEIKTMSSSSGTLAADTGNCGRFTDRSSVSRPRYQKGSLEAIGKNCWTIRWREDVRDENGKIVKRVKHRETLRQMSKAQAGEILDARLSEVKMQQRQPGISLPFSKFVTAEWKANASLRLRKSSMRIYCFNLDNHVLPAI